MSLDTARAVARRHAANVTQGANPSVQRKAKRAAITLLDVIEAYLRDAKTRQRPRSYKETERHLRRHAAPLHHERADALHRRDIAPLLDRVAAASGPIAANRLRAALSALWTWGLRTGLIEAESNPVSFTPKHAEKPRERTLTDEELKAIWKATEGGGEYDRIVRLCLLTGCRREEIGALRWDEVHDDQLKIGTERMKGGIAHEVPLLPAIVETLPVRHESGEGCAFGRRGTGFSGWSKSKRALDAKLAKTGHCLTPWTLHDLRRTFSTRLHDAGIEPLVVEALLAHKQQGVAAVYNRASFREAKRLALIRWHVMLGFVMTPEEVAARRRREREGGRNAVRRFASNPAMQERYIADFVPAEELAHLPIDPDVPSPADVQARIARSKAANRKFKKSWRKQELLRPKGPAGGPFFITSVVKNEEVQERRDAALSALENQSEGKRGQPLMLFRLRVVLALVDRHRAEGVPFGTGPNSRMNKLVLEDLNKMAARSRDSRKSRPKQWTAGAVRYLLRQIKGLVD